MVGIEIAIDRICIYIIGKNLHGVAMHVDCVLIIIVYHLSTVCGHSISIFLIIFAVMSEDMAFIHGVGDNYITKSLAICYFFYSHTAVANESKLVNRVADLYVSHSFVDGVPRFILLVCSQFVAVDSPFVFYYV